MPNQHATTVTALSIPSTAEMFVFAFAPFSENQAPGAGGGPALGGIPGIGPLGVILDANLNVTVTAGGTVQLRWRYGSLTGPLLPSTNGGPPAAGTISTVAAATASNVSAFALDPTIQEVNAVYVLTLTSAGGVGSIAYGVGTAMDATTFE